MLSSWDTSTSFPLLRWTRIRFVANTRLMFERVSSLSGTCRFSVVTFLSKSELIGRENCLKRYFGLISPSNSLLFLELLDFVSLRRRGGVVCVDPLWTYWRRMLWGFWGSSLKLRRSWQRYPIGCALDLIGVGWILWMVRWGEVLVGGFWGKINPPIARESCAFDIVGSRLRFELLAFRRTCARSSVRRGSVWFFACVFRWWGRGSRMRRFYIR